jgi:hypothetical protein
MNSELHRVDQRIAEDVELVASLKDDLVPLKEEYGRMLLFAYRNRSAYDRMSYLFASTSFQQAYKRSRYLAQIAEQRTRQAALIEETRATIDQRLIRPASPTRGEEQLVKPTTSRKAAAEQRSQRPAEHP